MKRKTIINIDVIAVDTLEITHNNHTTQMIHPNDITEYISKLKAKIKKITRHITKDWLVSKLKSLFDDVSLRRILNNKMDLYIYIYIYI